jgi:hypothetical protein
MSSSFHRIASIGNRQIKALRAMRLRFANIDAALRAVQEQTVSEFDSLTLALRDLKRQPVSWV